MSNGIYSNDLSANDLGPSWSPVANGDSGFRKILIGLFVLFVVISIAVPFLSIPEIKREQAEKLPEHLARVIIKRKEIAAAPAKIVVKKVEKKKPKPSKKVIPKKAPIRKTVSVKKVSKPIQSVAAAKKKAASTGLLAFQDDLMAMRQLVKPSQLSNQRLSNSGAKAVKKTRKLIAAKQLKGSGGINTSRLTNDTGHTSLSAHQSTEVLSGIESADSLQLAGNAREDGIKSRSIEEVRRIFDRNKGAIYAIYNRAIRKNPGLQGKVVLELVIEPSGVVSACEIVSSELNNKRLERKLVTRIKMFSFGEKDVSVTRVNYPIEFLPS